MKKTNARRSFWTGMLTMALLVGLVTTAHAALTGKTITVSSGVKIVVDGAPVTPTDVNGKAVETLLYNGTTYVPIRAISQIFNKEIAWDGATNTVSIGKAPGSPHDLLAVCPPYSTEYCDVYNDPAKSGRITMGGEKYLGLKLGRINAGTSFSGVALFNLNGQYNTLSFDVGKLDSYSKEKTYVTITLDGVLVEEIKLDPYTLPQHYEIPLNSALQLKISGNSNSCIVNAEIK